MLEVCKYYHNYIDNVPTDNNLDTETFQVAECQYAV
jgi:hypothetical protein